MTLKMAAPICEAAEPRRDPLPPGAHNGAHPAGSLRDWRGVKYHLSTTTDEELLNVLAHAQCAYQDLVRFVAELQAEWVRRQSSET